MREQESGEANQQKAAHLNQKRTQGGGVVVVVLVLQELVVAVVVVGIVHSDLARPDWSTKIFGPKIIY